MLKCKTDALIVGEEEEKNGTISIRRHGQKEKEHYRYELKNLQWTKKSKNIKSIYSLT
jgi:threonyl-tRNA synthetase